MTVFLVLYFMLGRLTSDSTQSSVAGRDASPSSLRAPSSPSRGPPTPVRRKSDYNAGTTTVTSSVGQYVPMGYTDYILEGVGNRDRSEPSNGSGRPPRHPAVAPAPSSSGYLGRDLLQEQLQEKAQYHNTGRRYTEGPSKSVISATGAKVY